MQISSGKLITTVFWDMEGILLIVYMKKCSTITREVYKETIKKLKTSVHKPYNCDQKIVLFHDNCRVHKARQAGELIDDCGFMEMEHTPYSPDLAPNDRYVFFPNLKKEIRRIFLEGIALLKKCWHNEQYKLFLFITGSII